MSDLRVNDELRDSILKINYKSFSLGNGLNVILYPDNSLPLTAVNIWYRVGSANERKGKTGFAHLFEHMMFQGSKNVAKQMHFRYIQEAGGNLNGSTSLDRTNYYQTVPSNYLDLVLWLESDRMGFLLPALNQEKLDNQIDVVKNERRQRYDNAPYGLAWQLVNENLYPEEHPYHWPTIGYMDDISAMTLEDVRDFFNRYYIPNNASLVIAGDIDQEAVMERVERYFGDIKAGEQPVSPEVPEFSLKENKHIVHEDNVQLPKMYIAWHSIPAYKENEAALDVLAHLLAGSKNSRLYKTLVFEQQTAQSISAFQYSSSLDGMFVIVANPKPGVTPETLKNSIMDEITRVAREGITAAELERVKNGIKAAFIYSMQNISNIADHLNAYNFYLSKPDGFLYDLNRFEKLTEEDIRKAAENYLTKNYVRVDVIPGRK